MKGRILSLNIGNELNFSYDYDEYGRLNKISTLAGDFNYTYLANSNIIEQISRPNNITTIWSYEPHRDVITQISNGNISVFNYQNNAIGNRISINRNGTSLPESNTISYTYDNRNEVIGAISDKT